MNADIDECKEKKACQCPECMCKNTWGSYDCTCSGDLLYIKEHDACIGDFTSSRFRLNLGLNVALLVLKFQVLFAGKTGSSSTTSKSGWAAVCVIMIGLSMAAAGAYLVYKYRLRVSQYTAITAKTIRGIIEIITARESKSTILLEIKHFAHMYTKH